MHASIVTAAEGANAALQLPVRPPAAEGPHQHHVVQRHCSGSRCRDATLF